MNSELRFDAWGKLIPHDKEIKKPVVWPEVTAFVVSALLAIGTSCLLYFSAIKERGEVNVVLAIFCALFCLYFILLGTFALLKKEKKQEED